MANPRAAHRIVVAEDEEMIRDFLVTSLRRRGYEVDAVTDGDEAAELFKIRPETVGLLLTDITMPGKNGIQLVEEVQAIRPDLPIVVMSGYKEEENINLPGVLFLHKPFKIEQLLNAVESKLRGGATQTDMLPGASAFTFRPSS